MAEAGVARVMVTDIGQDGGMKGPNLALYEQLVAELPVPVVASGGVGTYDHLVALAGLGCEGVIVGKALYEGAIDLPAAIAAVSDATR
jgi:phosphoribosylformimino-5-aminoimidazole carboxamide ribonucleotide (ProFAR) isomerase